MKDSHLDTNRLEKIRKVGAKITARCPACAADGGDSKGQHLVIFPNRKFGCAAMQGDAEHRRRIFSLVGVVGDRERDPQRERLWREARAKENRTARERDRLVATAQAKRSAIIARHPWTLADVSADSPQRVSCPLVESDPRHFLASLFPGSANLWTGEVTESGRDGLYFKRWRTCQKWHSAPDCERVGPMVTPATWKSGAFSRSAVNVESAPYVVLDFDGFDGNSPTTPEQLQAHIHASLALIRWIREGLHWQLAAILWTGSKSMHAWFQSPPNEVLESLRVSASALGVDAGLVGNSEHPCRLPGHVHAKTGNKSRVLWLQNSISQPSHEIQSLEPSTHLPTHS